MANATTAIVYEHPRAPRALVERILREMAIPSNSGLLLWLDGELGRDALTPAYRNRGVFCTSTGGFGDLPDKMLKRIGKRPYAIWLSREEVDGDETEFALTLAHELRHLEQHMYDPSLYYAGSLATEYLLWLSTVRGVPGRWLDSPLEWDAESRAREIATRIYPEETVHAAYTRSGKFEMLMPQRVAELDEVANTIREWLRARQTAIAEALREDRHVGEDTIPNVDWDRFGLPSFATLR